MDFVLTLTNIFVSDVEKVGYRAVDLSTMARRNYKIPLCFVINSHALEEFVKYNNLMEKGADFLAKGDYEALQAEFMRGIIPDKVMTEIRESYDSVSVSGGDATSIVATQNSPYVTAIASPNYLTEDAEIIQNIKGLENLIQVIKTIWASLFSKQAFQHRASKGIREFFAGIIIQQMPQSVVSASGKTLQGNDKIVVETWFGLPDFGLNFEKDYFEVSKEYLRIEKSQIKHQVHKLDRDENNVLENVPLEGTGSKQKLDDKAVVEVGRLTKKMSAELQQGVKTYYTIDKNNIYLLFGDRVEGSSPAAVPAPAAVPTPEPVQEAPAAVPESTPEPVAEVPAETPAPQPEEQVPGEDMPTPEPSSEAPPPVIEKEEPSHVPTPDTDVPQPMLETPVTDDTPSPTDEETEEQKEELPSEEEYDFLDELEGEKVDEEEAYVPEEVDSEPEFETVPVSEDAFETQEPENSEQSYNQAVPEPTTEAPQQMQTPQSAPEPVAEPEPYQEPLGTAEETDERIEMVSHLKEMMDELEALVSYGDQGEIEHKTNEIHETIKRLKDMSK